MKKSFSILGLFLLVVGAPAVTPPPATGPVQPLALQEVVGIALQKNPGIQAAEAYGQAVQEGITAAKSFRRSLPTGAPS
jgi:outer membrane protein TolC